MVDRVGVHRLDDAEVIDHFRGPRQQFADPCAGLAVLVEFEDRRRERKARLPGGHAGEALALFLEPAVEILLEALFQLRLVVEQIELRRRADQRDVDHAFRLRGDLRQHAVDAGQAFRGGDSALA